MIGIPFYPKRCLRIRRLVASVMVAFLIAGTGAAQETAWSAPKWPTAAPAALGLDPAKLEEAKEYALSAGGSGMIIRHGHANVEALSRLGYLYLHQGRWQDQQLVSKEFVKTATTPSDRLIGLPEFDPAAHGNASDHYGLLWWNNGDGSLPQVPRDAFWAWGLYDSLIIVIPSLDLVVVRAGEAGKRLPRPDESNHYAVLGPLLHPIIACSPVPPSKHITGIKSAPAESILRLADGSDNWPLTWADDDHLYTAYGDGWGFEPRVEEKLSLGLARVQDNPLPDDAAEIRGENIRSATAEVDGDGHRGKKASGMLMVDGVLYMWARNAANSQLAWSKDHGKTWRWADWRWTTSFGCPTFLNFGKNYANARDEFVYVYSNDSDSAYEASDRMVLARVPKDRIMQQAAYEFLASVDAEGRPQWTDQINQRGSVFTHPGRCYRGGVTYNSKLQRYLWCQVLPESTDTRGPRFQGGFGIYDAAEPWGPWTTVDFTNEWDVGPGETSSLPTKWISQDGKTVHLVFSGDDHFSVRRAALTVAKE